MKVTEMLDALITYYDKTIGVGHTYTTIHGLPAAAEDDKIPFFCGVNQEITKELLRSCKATAKAVPITINTLQKLLGARRPIVFDNGALYMLFRAVRSRLAEQDAEIDLLRSRLEARDAGVVQSKPESTANVPAIEMLANVRDAIVKENR